MALLMLVNSSQTSVDCSTSTQYSDIFNIRNVNDEKWPTMKSQGVNRWVFMFMPSKIPQRE